MTDFPPAFLQSCNPQILQCCRPPEESDAVDGVLPRAVVEPESAAAVAALLAWASAGNVGVVLRGSGTRLGWGRKPAAIDLVVSMRRLNRVVAHQHGDLTATVEAGATIAGVNRELMRQGQWLPIDAVDEQSTIGGAVATNDSGPLRQRYGTPRDLLIGIQLATTDGRLVKAGGNVVKNVAGYDLGKLISGSFGSLAAIATATFKLAPLPAASATAVATFRDADAIGGAAAAVAGSQLEPVAFDVGFSARDGTRRSQRLLIQFASTGAAVDAQLDGVRRLIEREAEALEVLTGDAEWNCWRDHQRLVRAANSVVVRANWLPANLARVLAIADAIARERGCAIEAIGRAGVGAGFMRIEGGQAAITGAVERLRRSDEVGHVVLVRAPADVKAAVDVWGPPGDRAALLASVKRAFDPAGILNAGRGPI